MVRFILCAAVLLAAQSASAQGQAKAKGPAKTQSQKGNPTPPAKDLQRCDSHTCEYPLASQKVTGDVVRGPRTINATGLNVLRYDYSWNNTVSFGAAPDLWSKLATITASTSSNPPAPPQSQTTKLAGGPNIPPELQAPIAQADKLIDDTGTRVKSVTDKKATIQNNADDLRSEQPKAASATSAVKTAGKSLTDFLGTSTGVPDVLIPQMRDQLADTDSTSTPKPSRDSLFITGTKASWSDLDKVKNIRDSSQALSNQLDSLKTDYSTYVPQQTAALESAKGALNSLIAKLQQESQTAAAARKVQIDPEVEILDEEVNVKLRNAESDLAYANQLLANWEIPTNSQTLSAVSDLDTSSSKYTEFRTAQDALVTWK